MLSLRRKPFKIGRSQGVTLPGAMTIGKEVAMAASDRLLLVDTTGKLFEDKLLQFFIEHVEPAFQRWLESQKRMETAAEGAVRAAQDMQEVHIQPTPGAVPGLPIYDVTCARCREHFHWDLSRGDKGYCPFCGMYLQFVAP